MIQLMAVPPALLASVNSGAAFIQGALVKDAVTHQILGHLQPTGQLTQLLSKAALGTNPVGAAAMIASEVGQHVQLVQIKGMIETLQTISTIGAGASVLGLGVSVGGFAMVIASLRRMESRLDGVAASVQALAASDLAESRGRAIAALTRAEDAFYLSSPAERRRYWQEADLALSNLIEITLQRLAARGIPLTVESETSAETESDRAGRLASPEVIDELRWLIEFARARAEILLCLQAPSEATRLWLRVVEWMHSSPISAQALARARLGNRVASPSQIRSLANQAKAISLLISETGTVADERAIICDAMHRQDVDTEEYVLQVRSDPEKRLLLMAHTSEA